VTSLEHSPERPWSVCVALEEVPEAGRHLELIADECTRAAVAKLAGLRALPRLSASFDLARRGRDRLHVTGRVCATVGQNCVVTLEPVDNDVEEPLDLVFSTKALSNALDAMDEDEGGFEIPADDAPEPLVDGKVDLGALATEFLMLGIDPYPRKPDAVFEPPPAGDEGAHPFAALAALKKGEGRKDG
jgi:hypothetical protein